MKDCMGLTTPFMEYNGKNISNVMFNPGDGVDPHVYFYLNGT
jgi:hypothetical protein